MAKATGTDAPIWFIIIIFSSIGIARAQQNQNQNQTSNATTVPAEVAALNTIFQQWGISFPTSGEWNVSGNPCTGAAINPVTLNNNAEYNPGIKCDCSFDGGATCHIIRLRVYELDARGVIPDELWTLTFLTNLDLGRNILTGPLSPSIGKLTRMQYLSVGVNAFSGEIPKELGLLTDLRSLSFSANNFSGPLPSEIGNLRKLEQLYIYNSGVSGPIPLSFAALQKLRVLWASGINLTGNIPDFIGNWTELKDLRLQGNSFEGPIPLTFSNLKLESLRISDLSNGSSQLTFIQHMTSLKTLILRNNNISGSIPNFTAEFLSLSSLDLSFNNLVGRIPDVLFNLSSLSFLFLGNNKLTGSIPVQKSQSLLHIDLSYNELSGPFPIWIRDNSLQINLVANNFTIGRSDNSALPSGLNCLQRNFPCGRGLPSYFNLSINCGGPQIISSNGITFESENEALGPAKYFMTSTRRWAVSNAGRFAETTDLRFTVNSTLQLQNNSESELFQTARKSPGSLRYYGLSLENGNYTVSLQFAEIDIPNEPRWQSLGRRVFDVYIQGKLELKNFEIRKMAGGGSRSLERKFTANVSENYLEIHLFWAGKGTCCIPAPGTYGPLISAITATPDFIPTVSNIPPSSKQNNNTSLIAGVIVSVGVVILASLLALYFYIQKRKRLETIDDEEFLGMDTKPYMFSYDNLRDATEDFASTNKLGEGGFGPVYKGTLSDGRVVAVKQLSVTSHQGKKQFVAEIATISAVHHRNLVELYGCCVEGNKRLLVYEYLENKSLDQALFGKASLILDWPTRFDICLGVARGLAYLHEESRVRIVHRDVKASNILLDSNLNPKISDFGLAKHYDEKKTHISTHVAGTIGYLAPEYAMRGQLTEKADVFGFGVVALEIVSGRPNSGSCLETNKIYLLEWAWNLHEKEREVELVDSKMSSSDEFNKEQVKRVIGVALLCIQASPLLRPSMSRVVAMMLGDVEVGSVSTRPGYLAHWEFSDTTTTYFSTHASNNNNNNNNNKRKKYTSSSSSTGVGTSSQMSPINDLKPLLRRCMSDNRLGLKGPGDS